MEVNRGVVYFQPYIDELVSVHSAELRRLRIAHLRRMVEASIHVEERVLRSAWRSYPSEYRVTQRFQRFRNACRAEIARLRGEG